MMTITMRTLAAALLVAALVPSGLGAAERHVPPSGMALYIMVLDDGYTRPASRAKREPEPDVAGLGGLVFEARTNRRLIAATPELAEQLRRHSRVSYLQRVWDGASAGEPERPRERGGAVGEDALQQSVRVGPESTTPSWEAAYAYDGSGNIITAGNDEYRYDTAGRLVRAEVGSAVETYSYDAFGNLRIQPASGTAGPIADPATNRLSGWTYDAAGNQTADGSGRTYTYDPAGMMTGMASTASTRRMIYTADDERVAVYHGTGTPMDDRVELRVRDFSGKVLSEWHKTVVGVEWVRDYVYAEGRLVGGERQVGEGASGVRHYHLDQLGSTRRITRGDASAAADIDYFPFGGEATSATNEFTRPGGQRPLDPAKFTGHERDYLGAANDPDGAFIDYMHARYYDAGVGRFLSVDPGSFDLRRPQTWNRYSYATNNPLVFTDPDGRNPRNALRAGMIAYLVRDKVTSADMRIKTPVFGGGSLTKLGQKLGFGIKGIEHFSLDVTGVLNGRDVIDLSFQSGAARGLGAKLKMEMSGLSVENVDEFALLWSPFEKSLIQANSDKFKIGWVWLIFQQDIVDIDLDVLLPYLFELGAMGDEELFREFVRRLQEEEEKHRKEEEGKRRAESGQ